MKRILPRFLSEGVTSVLAMLASLWAQTASAEGTATTYTNQPAKVVFKMSDPSDLNANTVSPEGAFRTVAFDIGVCTIKNSNPNTATITNEQGQSTNVTGVKICPKNDKDDVLTWQVCPAKGLTFTPTKVSGYVNRDGTDVEDGIKIIAHNGDNSKAVSLAEFTAWRNGKKTTDEKYSSKAKGKYEITLTNEQQNNLKSADGFYLTSTVGVASGKNGIFGEVTIEGTLTGTIENVQKYTLETAVSPAEAGTITLNPNQDQYDEGSTVKVSVAKNFGYKFVNWTNSNNQEVSKDLGFTYTVKAADKLTANFEKVNTYALDYGVEGGAKDYMVTLSPAPEKVDGKNMYEAGTEVTLTALSNDVIKFNNWSSGETSAELKVTMNENKTLVAHYSADDYIAIWDFYKTGNSGRVADFAAEDNDNDQLVLRDANGTTVSWLDKSQVNGGYEGKPGGVNWNAGELGTYYWQTMVNASAFTNIKVKSSMMYNYKAYKTYNVEYSLDGTNWNCVGAIAMEAQKSWKTEEFTLPEAANNKSAVYIRWIADKNAVTDGATQSDSKDGNAIGAIYITGTPQIVDDGKAPALQSTVPAADATNVTANGKVVLTFDEKVKLTDKANATLNGQTLEGGAVSGKTVTYTYKGLSYSTKYTFTLAAGSVADLTNNAIDTDITVNFTTKEKPAVEKALYDFVVPTDGTIQQALAEAAKRTDTSKRFRIFIMQGDYKIPANQSSPVTSNVDKKQYPNPTTYLNTPNVSIIGEGMDNTSITNTVPEELGTNENGKVNLLEGIGIGDVLCLQKNATNTYFQDLKMCSSMGDSHGRDIVLNDQSNKTICKNVKLWAYQDTYVSNNEHGKFYFEGGVLRGRTDFLCGKGDVFYNNVELWMCDKGGYLAVPSVPKQYGYIFKDCTIKDASDEQNIASSYYLGRPWGKGTPIAIYIDTKMEAIPAAAGWTEMSGGYPKQFAEYNSYTSNGSPVDLSSRKQSYAAYDTDENKNKKNERTENVTNTVLTAEDAAKYTIATVMGQDDDWDPTAYTEQASAPTNVQVSSTTLTWDNSNYALLWAVCKDGKVVDFTVEPKYTIDDVTAKWSVRAANEMGGLGEATDAVAATGIEEVAAAEAADVVSTAVYTIDGVQVNALQRGINIVVKTLADGSKKTEKVIVK